MKYVITTLAIFITSLSWAAEEALILQGKQIYGQHCARCHGVNGYGDGTDAKRLPVAPRNLVEDEYKFKSTEYGTPPSDQDLIHVLNYGMSGTGMPSFKNLRDASKQALVAYIKSISNNWGHYEPEPIDPPNEKVKPDLVRGQEMFETLQCALCHGTGGRANGTSAAGLAVKPANLTQGWLYKAGHEPRDIYMRLMSGIAGSGMPSYAETGFTEADMWHLANYVASLQVAPDWIPPIVAIEAAALPESPSDPTWHQARTTSIPLESGFYSQNGKEITTVDTMFVKAVYSETGLALHLSWNDPTHDLEGLVDAALVAVKPENLQDNYRDNLHTLYRPNDQPLELSYWRADAPNHARKLTSKLIHATKATASFRQARAASLYDNGLWSLVLTLSVSPGHADPPLLGFAAWDGGNKESGLKRSASQWVAVSYGRSKPRH